MVDVPILKNMSDIAEPLMARPREITKEFDEKGYFQLEEGVLHQAISASSFIEIDIEQEMLSLEREHSRVDTLKNIQRIR